MPTLAAVRASSARRAIDGGIDGEPEGGADGGVDGRTDGGIDAIAGTGGRGRPKRPAPLCAGPPASVLGMETETTPATALGGRDGR